MEKRLLSEEEIRELRNSKYVERVSSKVVTYSEEFKKEYMKRYLKGVKPNKIIKELGIDPYALGRDRIKSLTKRCKKYAERDSRFKDTRKNNPLMGRKKKDLTTIEEEYKVLKHKCKLLEQELKVIKKIEIISLLK